MPRTIQVGSVGDRIQAGDSVIAASASVNASPIRKRLLTFSTQHKSYAKAQQAVTDAETKLHDVRDHIGVLDAEQDAAVEALANALIGEGLPRRNPFKPFEAPAPSDLRAMGDVDEAKAALKLVERVQRRKGIGKATKAALTALEKAAKAVLAAAKPLKGLQRDHGTAIEKREALAQGWSNAFAALKRGARAAEDDGAKGLYTALFVRVPVKKKARKGATPVSGPAAAAGK